MHIGVETFEAYHENGLHFFFAAYKRKRRVGITVLSRRATSFTYDLHIMNNVSGLRKKYPTKTRYRTKVVAMLANSPRRFG